MEILKDGDMYIRIIKFRDLISSYFSHYNDFNENMIMTVDVIMSDSTNTPSDFHLRFATGREVIIFMDDDHIHISKYTAYQFVQKGNTKLDAITRGIYLEEEIETDYPKTVDGKIEHLIDVLYWGLTPVDYTDVEDEGFDTIPIDLSKTVVLLPIDDYVPINYKKVKGVNDVVNPFQLFIGVVKFKSFRKHSIKSNIPGMSVTLTFTTGIKAAIPSMPIVVMDAIKAGSTLVMTKFGTISYIK